VKKLRFSLVSTFLLVGMLMLSACGSNIARNIEGEWILTASSSIFALGSNESFLSDGRALWRSWGEEDWEEDGIRWRIDGNHFVFYSTDEDWEERYAFELDGYTLTLKGYPNPENYSVYTRPHAVQIESTAFENKLDEMMISLITDIGWVAPTSVRVLDATRLDISEPRELNPFILPTSTNIAVTVQSQTRGGGLTTTRVISRLNWSGEFEWNTVESFPTFYNYITNLDVARLNEVIVNYCQILGIN